MRFTEAKLMIDGTVVLPLSILFMRFKNGKIEKITPKNLSILFMRLLQLESS